MHVDPTKVGCLQVRQHQLRDVGIRVLGDVLTLDGGQLQQWEDMQDRLPANTRVAFEKLLTNIDLAKCRVT